MTVHCVSARSTWALLGGEEGLLVGGQTRVDLATLAFSRVL